MSDHLARLGYPDPHPPAWWCPTCGELEGAKVCCHTARHAGTPSGPPPVPAGREWAGVRRRNRAMAALARIGGARC